jgi:hypothetical protein
VGVHFGELVGSDCRKRPGGLVPFLKDRVCEDALPLRRRLGVECLERLQSQDRGCVKLVRVRAQPIERGDADPHATLLGERALVAAADAAPPLAVR